MASTLRSSFKKSRTSRTVLGESVLKNVEFVVTRNPRDFASRIAATASSKTPARADGRVVPLARPVHVHDPREVVRRRELVETPPQQHGIGAEVDVDLAGDELFDHPLDVGVQERLAPCDRHHRSAALGDGFEHVLDGQTLAQDLGRVLDLAAARARQVAREQGLDLDDEGVVLGLLQAVPHEMGTDTDVLAEGNRHQRTCVGREKRTVSSVVFSSLSLSGPSERRVSRTSWTKTSGAEAPAVSPMLLTPESQPSSSCDASSISSARQPSRSATSTRRAVLDEFAEPTTSMRSHRSRDRPDGVLAVLRGVADVVRRRGGDGGEPPAQGGDDLGGLVGCEGGLGQVHERARRLGTELEATDVLGPLHHVEAVRRLAESAYDLLVVGVPDQDEVVTLVGVAARLGVHLGDERAGGVDDLESSRAAACRRMTGATPWAASTTTESGGTSSSSSTKTAPFDSRSRDDVQVVNDLPPDVHRCPVTLEGSLDDGDGTVHAGAERARGGEHHLVLAAGRAHRSSGRRTARRDPSARAPPRTGPQSEVSEIERMTASGFFGRQPITQADSMSTATAPDAASAARSPART